LTLEHPSSAIQRNRIDFGVAEKPEEEWSHFRSSFSRMMPQEIDHQQLGGSFPRRSLKSLLNGCERLAYLPRRPMLSPTVQLLT